MKTLHEIIAQTEEAFEKEPFMQLVKEGDDGIIWVLKSEIMPFLSAHITSICQTMSEEIVPEKMTERNMAKFGTVAETEGEVEMWNACRAEMDARVASFLENKACAPSRREEIK